MYKTIVGINRREDLSLEQFKTHWHKVHADLVRRHADALGIVRYVQLHPPHESQHAKYDGIAEVWYESHVAMKEHLQSESGKKAAGEILEDEQNFMNGAGTLLFRGLEVNIID